MASAIPFWGHLAQGDVRVNDLEDPKFTMVRIKASKADPFRKGVSVYIGRTGTRLCPVAAFLSYIYGPAGKCSFTRCTLEHSPEVLCGVTSSLVSEGGSGTTQWQIASSKTVGLGTRLKGGSLGITVRHVS